MKVINRYNGLIFLCIGLLSLLASCQKMERPDMNIIPDDLERLNGPLQLYFPFNGDLTDSAQYQTAISSGTINYAEGVNQEALRQAIRHERQVELGMEHQRFFDLVRWGIAPQVFQAAGKNFQPRHRYLPIPQQEIDKSDGVLTQNPDY